MRDRIAMDDVHDAVHPAIEPLDAAGSVELAVLERSGMIESRHLGAAAVVAPDGSLLRAVGNADAVVYPRSSLKSLQAIAILRSGLQLDGERLALAAASHTGTARHIAVVHDILASAGLTRARCSARRTGPRTRMPPSPRGQRVSASAERP
jgi:L-asparaginase II